jgi:hypothetical protein
MDDKGDIDGNDLQFKVLTTARDRPGRSAGGTGRPSGASRRHDEVQFAAVRGPPFHDL